MKRLSKVIIAAVLAGAGTAGIGWFLFGEGLDRAEKWVSIVVGATSLAVAAAGLWLGLLSRRQTRGPGAPATTDDPAGKYRVDVSDAQGVAIGDHITQHNSFNEPGRGVP